MWLTARARSGTWPVCVLVLVALAAVPVLPIGNALLFELSVALVYAIAAVGMDLISGYGGQLSMAQFAFVGVGGYVFAIVRSYGVGVLLAAVAAAAFTGILAGVVGICLLQLRHIGAAIGTFFLAFVIENALAGQLFAQWTQGDNGINVSPVVLGGVNLSQGLPLYWMAWVVLAVVVAATLLYANSRRGLELRLVKHSEVVTAVLGINPLNVKLLAFVVAAVFASLAGVVYAIALGYLAPETFSGDESVNVFAMVVVGGMGSVAGPVIGAVFFIGLQTLLAVAGSAREIVFACVLLIVLIVFREGLYAAFEAIISRGWRLAKRVEAREADGDTTDHTEIELRRAPTKSASMPEHDRPTGDTVLHVEDLRVSFGGSQALAGVTFDVAEFAIHSIVGPNGAGKTTLLNCLSGLQVPRSGGIWLDGANIVKYKARRRCELGFGRTFQQPSLVPDLTVRENIRLGAQAGLRARHGGESRVRSRPDEAVAWAMDVTGIPLAMGSRLAKDLTYRDQKVVDLARALALHPRVLLLDEPDSGLDEGESGGLVSLLRSVHRAASVTIVLISHHVGLVLDVANTVTVLDAGRVIAHGSPESVVKEENVIEAFIGSRNVTRGTQSEHE